MGLRSPVFTVLVRGPSMVPTLRDGDALLVVRGRAVRPGDLVVGELAGLTGRLVVKRAVRPLGPDGAGPWWVEGDNPYGTDDSRTHGAATVHGRVVWRWWPPVRRPWPTAAVIRGVVRSLLRRHRLHRRWERP